MKSHPIKSAHTLLWKTFVLSLLIATSSVGCFAQSNLFGTTIDGGRENSGVIFKTNADGSDFSILKEFQMTTTVKDAYPSGSMVQASNGRLYGVTGFPGFSIFEFNPATFSYTRVFELGPTSSYVNKYSAHFRDFGDHARAPVQASNGKLYGATAGGGKTNQGILYEYDIATATFTMKHDFGSLTDDGANPANALIEVSGKLYGTTSAGGTTSTGTIFEYDPATGIYLKKFTFDDDQLKGAGPSGGLTRVASGKFYGVTEFGGANGNGTIYEYDIASGVFAKKFDFSQAAYPNGSLVEVNGKLYGMTSSDLSIGRGVIYEFDPTTSQYNEKVQFDGAGKGSVGYGTLTKTSNDRLYGMTFQGGANNIGVLFEYIPSTGVFTKKLDFARETGGNSYYTGITLTTGGKLYGVTGTGGTNNTGVIFEYDPATSVYAKKFDFGGPLEGAQPGGSLTQGANGKLYGISQGGGSNASGVIFEIDPVTSAFAKKYDFDGSANGGTPVADLTLAANGKLYGTTLYGGSAGTGTLFEFDPSSSTFVKKLDFTESTGHSPYGSMIKISNGKLYGMVSMSGSPGGRGVIFEYDPTTSVYSKKYMFGPSSVNGTTPQGALLEGKNGILYGMTSSGGTGAGTIFEFNPATSVLTKKVEFDWTVKGSNPRGSLVQAANGKLYAMASNGGPSSKGTLFEYDPTTGGFIKKVDFSGLNGSLPLGSLKESGNGKLYGMTSSGGTSSLGVLFEFDPETSAFVKKVDFTGTNGGVPWRGGLTFVGNTVTGDILSQQTAMVSLSPNPTTDVLTVFLPDTKDVKTITLYQNDGKTKDVVETSMSEVKINVRDYSRGLYFVRVFSNGHTQAVKFIKH